MNARSILANLLVAGIFGVVVPYVKGLDFLDVLLLIPYSLLSLFFVAPIVVDSVFQSPFRTISLGALFKAVAIGWIAGLLILWLGIATVSLRAGRLVAPPIPIGLNLALLSLLGCILIGALAGSLSTHSEDAVSARGRMRLLLLVLLLVILGVPRLLPESGQIRLMSYLTPEGLTRITVYLAPVVALAGAVLIVRLSRR